MQKYAPHSGRTKRSRCFRKAGFSLVEILIAIGVLALGMMGIAALFPYAVMSTGEAVAESRGASVARTATVSLKHYCLDLSREDSQWPYDFRSNLDAKGVPYRIPEDMSIRPDAEVVPYAPIQSGGNWQPSDYSWTATVLARPRAESPYPVQVAVWRVHRTQSGKGTFTAGSREVKDLTNVELQNVGPGDYLREVNRGKWYRITDVGTDTVTLAADALFNATATDLEIASKRRLVSLFDTTIP